MVYLMVLLETIGYSLGLPPLITAFDKTNRGGQLRDIIEEANCSTYRKGNALIVPHIEKIDSHCHTYRKGNALIASHNKRRLIVPRIEKRNAPSGAKGDLKKSNE